MLLLSPTSSTTQQLMTLYDPRNVSGLVLWLDANSLNSTISTGGSISSWTDRSTYGHVASQSNASYKPVLYKNKWNGNSVVYAAGASSRYMTIPRNACWESNNITIIAAYVPLGYVGTSPAKLLVRPYRTSGWTSPYSSWGIGHSYGTNDRAELLLSAGAALKDVYVDAPAIANYTAAVVITAKYDGTTTAVMRLNGISRTLTTAAGPTVSGNLDYSGGNTDLSLFCRSGYSVGEYSNVYLGDMLVYNSALSDANITIVESYLKTKYAVFFV
jgi:hypothetical protein